MEEEVEQCPHFSVVMLLYLDAAAFKTRGAMTGRLNNYGKIYVICILVFLSSLHTCSTLEKRDENTNFNAFRNYT